MFISVHTTTSLRFRRWSRKSYAAFLSIGKHVTIGNLKNIVADTFLGKQKNINSSLLEDSIKDKEAETSDPPEEMLELNPALLFVLPKRVRYKQEHADSMYVSYLWLMAIVAVGHFLFKSQTKSKK